MKRFRFLFLLSGSMVIAVFFVACGSAAVSTPQLPPATAFAIPADNSEVPRITPEELNTRLSQGEDIVIVDTRGKATHDLSHIAGSIMATANYDNIPQDQMIVFYCG